MATDSKADLWQRIETYFGGSKSMLVAGAASEAEFDKIERFTAFNLSQDYREFVLRYGGALIGSYEIAGIGQSEAMANDFSSSISLTKQYRSQNWPGTMFGLVISMDGRGNPICLMRDGSVVSFDHDVGEYFLFGKTFEEFIVQCCIDGQYGDLIENYQIPWPNDWAAQ